MYFDRFDVCNAWYLWACEWGEYAVITRLNRLGYRASVLLNGRDNLEDNGQAIYDALTARSLADPDWFKRKTLGREVDRNNRVFYATNAPRGWDSVIA